MSVKIEPNKIVCDSCFRILTFDDSDIKTKEDKKYFYDYLHHNIVNYIECPSCDNEIMIRLKTTYYNSKGEIDLENNVFGKKIGENIFPKQDN